MGKVTNGLKYVGKNFWKVLPIGSKINFSNQINPHNAHKIGTFGYESKSFLHDVYAILGISAVMGYGFAFAASEEWKPKEIKKYFNETRKEMNIEKEQNKLISDEYNNMIQKENPKTFQDSLDIYLKYGLPIKLLEPTNEQKKSALERGVKE